MGPEQLLQRLHVERLGPAQDELLHSGLQEIVDLPEEVGADRARPLDRLRIASDLRAPLRQDLVLAPPVVDRRERVPHVGVLRGELERDLLAAAADHDRYAPDRRGHELREPRLDARQGRPEISQPGRGGAELVPVLLVVALEPAGADAEDGAPAAQMVHRRHVRGQELRIPVAVRVHERAELRVARLGRDRGQEGQAGEVVAVGRAVEGEHVIPDPERVDAEPVCRPVRLADLLDRAVLGVDLIADAESHGWRFLLSSRALDPPGSGAARGRGSDAGSRRTARRTGRRSWGGIPRRAARR
jgi:hypothetical protein